MSKQRKFKSGDLIENIYTGEVEMVSEQFDHFIRIITIWYVDCLEYQNCYFTKTACTHHYRKLSYKDVKINLKKIRWCTRRRI